MVHEILPRPTTKGKKVYILIKIKFASVINMYMYAIFYR